MQVNKLNSIEFKQNNIQNNPNNNPKHKPNYAKITGYGCLGFGIGSILTAKCKKLKIHSYIGYIAGILALIHTGIIEYYHHKIKK